VDSQVGQGTAFTVYLPKAEEYDQPQARKQEQLPKGSGKILFVDDDEAPLQVGTRMLNHLGYETVASASALKALELFSAAPGEFSAVLTDLTMPQMTGLELAEAVTRIRPDIPVILCTGYDPQLDARFAREKGIRECIAKPYGLSELGNVLARALSRD
jgi:CheY-like chemotaxis protein